MMITIYVLYTWYSTDESTNKYIKIRHYVYMQHNVYTLMISDDIPFSSVDFSVDAGTTLFSVSELASVVYVIVLSVVGSVDDGCGIVLLAGTTTSVVVLLPGVTKICRNEKLTRVQVDFVYLH